MLSVIIYHPFVIFLRCILEMSIAKNITYITSFNASDEMKHMCSEQCM